MNGRLLARELVWFECKHAIISTRDEVVSTFYGMSMSHFAARMLSHELFELVVLPLQLLYPLIMIVHGRTQYFLGPLLPHDELIKMSLQHFRGYPRCANHAGPAERATSWLTGFIDARERLTAKV
jgi:hypothetical protein